MAAQNLLQLSLFHPSISLFPFFQAHKISHLPLSFFPRKSTIDRPARIFCRTNSQTQQQPVSENHGSNAVSSSPTKLDGTGAAAPSRGDLFLERLRARETLEQEKKKKVKRKNPNSEVKVSTNVACCYGCGAPLQTIEVDAPGYVDSETYELLFCNVESGLKRLNAGFKLP